MNMLRGRSRERGFSLVELMVALVLSLFLLAGLFTIFYSNRRTYDSQQALAALKDNQSLAAAVLSSTVRAAGYFPYNATYTSRSAAFPASGVTWTSAQSVFASGTTSGPDTLSVRLVPSNTLDCQGGTSGAAEINTFSIDGNGNLQCSINGANVQPLISPIGNIGRNSMGAGVQNLQVMIGVATAGGPSPSRYYAPDAMPASDWVNARSVVVTLTFFNPLFDAANTPAGASRDSQGQPRYIRMIRVIGLENLE